MKSVLYSIQPQWVEKIVNGEKTVEVRKTRPKLKPPFKCFIYCTKGKTELPIERKINRELEDMCDRYEILYWANGKVIGEFVCDKIIDIAYVRDCNKYIGVETFVMDDEILSEAVEIEKATCLTQSDLLTYGQGKDLYGIHISNLKIYDRPKELKEFGRVCDKVNGDIGCRGCEYLVNYYVGAEYDESECSCDGIRPLKRPFQSWGYCEEILYANRDKQSL